MHAVERSLLAMINTDKSFINKLNRDRRHTLIRKFNRVPIPNM